MQAECTRFYDNVHQRFKLVTQMQQAERLGSSNLKKMGKKARRMAKKKKKLQMKKKKIAGVATLSRDEYDYYEFHVNDIKFSVGDSEEDIISEKDSDSSRSGTLSIHYCEFP